MTRRPVSIKPVTTKQLNGRMGPRYIRSLKPEILAAIDKEYPPTAPFISTKWIARQIMDNPDDYEILGHAEPLNLKILISRYFLEVAKFKPFSNGQNGSRIFVRKIPKEIQQHGMVEA